MFKLKGLFTNKVYYTGIESDIHKWLNLNYPSFDYTGKNNRSKLLPEPMQIMRSEWNEKANDQQLNEIKQRRNERTQTISYGKRETRLWAIRSVAK